MIDDLVSGRLHRTGTIPRQHPCPRRSEIAVLVRHTIRVRSIYGVCSDLAQFIPVTPFTVPV